MEHDKGSFCTQADLDSVKPGQLIHEPVRVPNPITTPQSDPGVSHPAQPLAGWSLPTVTHSNYVEARSGHEKRMEIPKPEKRKTRAQKREERRSELLRERVFCADVEHRMAVDDAMSDLRAASTIVRMRREEKTRVRSLGVEREVVGVQNPGDFNNPVRDVRALRLEVCAGQIMRAVGL